MQATTTYLDRVRPAITQVGERFAALVAAAPDPRRKVPHSPDWTVQEVAAHVVTVAPRYAEGPERRGTWVSDPQELPELNQAQIQALGTHSTAELADRLRHELTALCEQIEGYGTAPPSFRFHGGELVPADVALGILLGELVVHGWDIAHAVQQPWPIDPGHVALILEGLAPIVPGWVDAERARGFTATFEVRLRGQATYVFAFQDGRLRVNPATRARSTRTSPPTRPPCCSCSTGGNRSGSTSPEGSCWPGVASPGSPSPSPTGSTSPSSHRAGAARLTGVTRGGSAGPPSGRPGACSPASTPPRALLGD